MPQTNESATVAKSKIFSHLNKAVLVDVLAHSGDDVVAEQRTETGLEKARAAASSGGLGASSCRRRIRRCP